MHALLPRGGQPSSALGVFDLHHRRGRSRAPLGGGAAPAVDRSDKALSQYLAHRHLDTSTAHAARTLHMHIAEFVPLAPPTRKPPSPPSAPPPPPPPVRRSPPTPPVSARASVGARLHEAPRSPRGRTYPRGKYPPTQPIVSFSAPPSPRAQRHQARHHSPSSPPSHRPATSRPPTITPTPIRAPASHAATPLADDHAYYVDLYYEYSDLVPPHRGRPSTPEYAAAAADDDDDEVEEGWSSPVLVERSASTRPRAAMGMLTSTAAPTVAAPRLGASPLASTDHVLSATPRGLLPPPTTRDAPKLATTRPEQPSSPLSLATTMASSSATSYLLRPPPTPTGAKTPPRVHRHSPPASWTRRVLETCGPPRSASATPSATHRAGVEPPPPPPPPPTSEIEYGAPASFQSDVARSADALDAFGIGFVHHQPPMWAAELDRIHRDQDLSHMLYGDAAKPVYTQRSR